jgi:hypothetical protein
MRIRKKYVILVNARYQENSPYALRQDACWNTWFQDQRHFPPDTFEIFFIHRIPTLTVPYFEPGRLWVPGTDRYCELHIKMQMAYRWVMDHYDFDKVFKCDDDNYIFLDRLEKMLDAHPDTPFLGADLGHYTRAWGFVSGGSGYGITPELVSLAAATPIHIVWREDTWYSNLFKQNGYPLTHVDYLEPGFHHDKLYYSKWIQDPRMICLHYSRPSDMYLIHYLKKTGQLAPEKRVSGMAQAPGWNQPLYFLANGVFYSNRGVLEGSWRLMGQELSIHWDLWGLQTFHYQEDTMMATGAENTTITLDASLSELLSD